MKKLFVIIMVLMLSLMMFTSCGSTAGEGASAEDETEAVSGEEVAEEEPAYDGVARIIASIKPENISDLTGWGCDAETLVKVLNDAVANELTEDEAEQMGAALRPADEIPNDTPWINYLYISNDGEEESGIKFFENDKTDITGVELSDNRADKIAYFEDKTLYDLVRRAYEADLPIDQTAFDNYGAKAEEAASACLESEKDDMGLTDIKLVHFEKIWEGKDDDGNNLLLFDYEFSVGAEKPEEVFLAAGMRFDYEMRLRTFNGYYGQLAVKAKNDEMIDSALIVNDEMVYVADDMTEEDEEFIIDRIKEKLG